MLESFDKNMKDLLRVCETIRKAKDGLTLQLKVEKRPDPIMRYYHKYTQVYNRTDPKEHIPDVVALFKRHRSAILRGTADDAWLRDKSVTLQFGDGDSETRDIKVMISAFYNYALQVKAGVEKQLEGLDPSAYEERVDLVYGDVLKLYLYRTFEAALQDHPDQGEVSKIVKELEKELGLTEDAPVNTTPGLNLGNVLSQASQMIQQHGGMPNANMPSGEDLAKMISGFLGSPAIRNTLGSLMGSLQGAKSPDDIMAKAAEAMKGLMSAATAGAAGPAEEPAAPAEEKSLVDL